jgi:aminomethyltransferase
VPLRRSPLDHLHRSLGARLVPFGGWELPLHYPQGTLHEHRVCRTSAVVFDVSHLGTVRVEGEDAFEVLQAVFTNDLAKIGPGRCQYTHLLDEDGSVADDLIIWWRSPDCFDVMPNASNTARVLDALGHGRDVTHTRALLAVQGPLARQRLSTVLPEAAEVGRFRVAEVDLGGIPGVVAGTGYTGEDGVEMAVPLEDATRVWELVVSAGIEPAGLGARDTLRLEAGLPLHGHELGVGITPLNAGLGWVVAWDKGDFRGRAALEAQRDGVIDPVLRGLLTDSRRPPREDQAVLRDGHPVGHVTSGNFSPTLERGIALAFTRPDVVVGDTVEIDLRGTLVPATVVELPFVGRG